MLFPEPLGMHVVKFLDPPQSCCQAFVVGVHLFTYVTLRAHQIVSEAPRNLHKPLPDADGNGNNQNSHAAALFCRVYVCEFQEQTRNITQFLVS